MFSCFFPILISPKQLTAQEKENCVADRLGRTCFDRPSEATGEETTAVHGVLQWASIYAQ